MGPVSFSLQVTTGGQSATTTVTAVPAGAAPASGAPPATLANPNGPGAVITVVGNGPNVRGNFVSSQSDSSDLFGIVIVLAVIFVSIAATRWLFGRGGTRGRRVPARPARPPENGR